MPGAEEAKRAALLCRGAGAMGPGDTLRSASGEGSGGQKWAPQSPSGRLSARGRPHRPSGPPSSPPGSLLPSRAHTKERAGGPSGGRGRFLVATRPPARSPAAAQDPPAPRALRRPALSGRPHLLPVSGPGAHRASPRSTSRRTGSAALGSGFKRRSSPGRRRRRGRRSSRRREGVRE